MPTPPTFTCLAQVKWDQHGSSDLHTHVYLSSYGGSLTFLAEKIQTHVQKNTLVGAQVLTIAGQDYSDALLMIQHVLPLAHWGKPTLFKAFFSATQIPMGS